MKPTQYAVGLCGGEGCPALPREAKGGLDLAEARSRRNLREVVELRLPARRIELAGDQVGELFFRCERQSIHGPSAIQ